MVMADRIEDSQPAPPRLGVDVGGTKIEAAAVFADGRIGPRRRVPTPKSYDAFLRDIREVVAAVGAETGGVASVGVGHPGSISPANGLMRNASAVWLNGKPFDTDLADALGRPVRLANDADCFALSEAIDGAGKDGRIVFGAILGTGTGGGVVVDKTLLPGAQKIAGEWGHNPLPWPRPDELPGPECWCGKRGCFEKWISGTGFARSYEAAYGRALSSPEIMDAARAGDADATAAFDAYVDRLARGLASIMNVIDPHVIVLGGGMSNVEEIYDATSKRLADYVFSDVITTRVVRNVHGDSSGVRGAAWLWSPHEAGGG